MNNMINNDKLRFNSYWITGFTDAEECFYILYTKSKGYKTGWRVQAACFQIGLHIRDIELLRNIIVIIIWGLLSINLVIFTIK